MRDATLISEEALFRHGVVSVVLALEATGLSRADAITTATAVPHTMRQGQVRRVHPRTLGRWLAAFEADGIRGLEPKSRKRTDTSLILDPKLIHFLHAERINDREASIPELLRRAERRGIVESAERIDRTTVWRAMRRMGLDTRRTKRCRDRDMRRFSYPHRMQMVLFDGKHFRAGANRLRRVAIFYLDDATRRGLDVIVGTDETTELFLSGLYGCIRRHGLFDFGYADNGAGFASDDAQSVFAQGLEIPLINGTAGYPEGRGKIERFNRRAKAEVLRGLDSNAAVNPDCAALTLRLRHYLQHEYNPGHHETLGQSPDERWDADDRPLRFPESDAELRNAFLVTDTRDVSADNVISYRSTLLEIPRGHAKTTIEIYRQVLDGTLHILHDGRFVRLHPVDMTDNAYARRAPTKASAGQVCTPPNTAASLSYDRDFGPIVGPDGGFKEE